jgi:hypothetical protein
VRGRVAGYRDAAPHCRRAQSDDFLFTSVSHPTLPTPHVSSSWSGIGPSSPASDPTGAPTRPCATRLRTSCSATFACAFSAPCGGCAIAAGLGPCRVRPASGRPALLRRKASRRECPSGCHDPGHSPLGSGVRGGRIGPGRGNSASVNIRGRDSLGKIRGGGRNPRGVAVHRRRLIRSGPPPAKVSV